MRVLVTGSEGYIGAIVAPKLMQLGHDVVGMDTGFYREGWLYSNGIQRYPACINQDIRLISTEDLAGFDAVVHLAELSNDPLGQLHETVTHEINHLGSVELARKCKAAGVTRFVYTSSCSVYGVGSDEFKTELSEVEPQTAYARCKVLVERDVAGLADEKFSPTFLRNATAFGISPRMRFDVVLNNLAGLAWTTGQIKMTSDGTPWRPLVHVLDISQAIACTLSAPRCDVHNEIFNVGDTECNYRVREIAQTVSEAFPGCKLSIGSNDGDRRSYRVSFDKVRSRLPGFECKHDAAFGARQFRDLFERIRMPRETFEFRAYTRLRQVQHLLNTAQVDHSLFWK